MLAPASDGPSVSMSFANNFWGKDDAGVGPLLERMQGAKQTCDELKSFYNTRASIEDDYARKLMSLCRKPLGTHEAGNLKVSMDVMRGEVESMAKQHQSIAQQMKTDLEEPLAAFAGAMKERRKIVQNSIEKLHKIKMQQTAHVNKTRDRYEQECLKIKGYLAQGHMVMGQEERKNKAKLEKTQISVVTTNTEYENAVKILEETTARWNREWKAAADKFQDLEEERLDFTKSSLWTFANIASTVCVSDDASCEKIRLSLEKLEVEKDIAAFIRERGTGQEIPDPPKYINFCRGDADSVSDMSEDDYSVAQFPRSINPAYRTSSPQPSTFESHHDPNSALARELVHDPEPPQPQPVQTSSRETTITPQKAAIQAQPPAQNQTVRYQQQQLELRQKEMHQQEMRQQEMRQQELQRQQEQRREQQRYEQRHESRQQAAPRQLQQQPHQQQLQQHQNQQTSAMPYDPNEFAPVPHDPYPMDGMTMLCRTGGGGGNGNVNGSDLGSQVSSNSAATSARPSSRDADSDFSNLTPYSSHEVTSGSASPVKASSGPNAVVPVDDKKVMKKKSGFFQNHSPFRRKSTKDASAAAAAANRNSWHPSAQAVNQQGSSMPSRASVYGGGNSSSSSIQQQPQYQAQQPKPQSQQQKPQQQQQSPQKYQPQNLLRDRAPSPDPIDANASLALNIGQNVFPVSKPAREAAATGGSSGAGKTAPAAAAVEDDPIALALQELKGVTLGKNSSVRMSADHYHGLSTPAPGAARGSSSSAFANNSAAAAGMRGTPPPSYDQQVQRLGVPSPAVTSKAMKQTSQKFAEQTRSMFSPPSTGYSGGGAASTAGSVRGSVAGTSRYGASAPSRTSTTRNSYEIPRATSPAPAPRRSASPQPPPTAASQPPAADPRQNPRAASPNPYAARSASPNPHVGRSASPNPYAGRSASPNPYAGRSASPNPYAGRSASPNPYAGRSASPNPYAARPPSRQQPRQQPAQEQQRPTMTPNRPPTQGQPSMTPSRPPTQGQPSMTPSRPPTQGQQYKHQSPNDMASRAASPAPYRTDYNARPQSGMGSHMNSSSVDMAVQLAPAGPSSVYGGGSDDGYGSQRSRGGASRPGTASSNSRAMGLSRHVTRDGRPILHFARALYMYNAAIPEELGFAKGDTLAILRHQDDGWWEATVHGGDGQVGLVPSNYVQPC